MSNLQDELINAIVSKQVTNNPLEDSIEDTRKNIIDSIKDSVALKDAYGNKLEAIGTDNKVDKFDTYGMSSNTLNWPLWLALYNDNWVFKRAIDKPAQDEIRCGITLQGTQDFSGVYRELKKYRTDFIQLLQWGALFGGAIGVLLFDNVKDKDYKEPLTKEIIKSSKCMKMYCVDRWYGVAPSTTTVKSMKDVDFGKPKYYDVTMADGNTIRFHHSYVLRYEHRTAPQFVKRGMLQGWGYAEGSHIINCLQQDEKLTASVQSLIDKSLIEVIKMSGMKGIFMGNDEASQQQLQKRLEMVNWGRNFNSLTFLDKDDDYNMNEFSGLTGLSNLLEQNMWKVSSALEMQGILFGDLKNGWSQDEYALERYDETINNRCEAFVRPLYEKFLKILFVKYDINERIEFTFNSLLTKQQDKDTLEAMKSFVELGKDLLDSGVIDTKKFAEALMTYSQEHKIDFNITEKEMEELKENFENELESIDLNEIK